MKRFFRKRNSNEGENGKQKDENGIGGEVIGEDEPELPSVSTFLSVHPESPTSSSLELDVENEVIIRHSTPRSVSRYDDFPTENTKLARMLSPIPEQESGDSLDNVQPIKDSKNATGATNKEKKKAISRIPVAIKVKKPDLIQKDSVTAVNVRSNLVSHELYKPKRDSASSKQYGKTNTLEIKRKGGQNSESLKRGLVEKPIKLSSKNPIKGRTCSNEESDISRSEANRRKCGIRAKKPKEVDTVKTKVINTAKNQSTSRMKDTVKTKGLTRSTPKKRIINAKQTGTESEVKGKTVDVKTCCKNGRGAGNASTKIRRDANSSLKNNPVKDDAKLKDEPEVGTDDTFSGKRTEELHEEFARLCAEVKANKERILENDEILFNQDDALEGLMADAQVLAETNEGLTKELRGIKDEHDVVKEKLTEVRVALRTNILDAQMYDNESDKIQEEIWAIRKQIIELEFMPEATEDFKRQLRETQEENEKLEKELNRLEKGDHSGIVDFGVYSNQSTEVASPLQDDENGQRIIVIPKIHRRGNANNARSFFRKIDPSAKLRKPPTLPSIKNALETDGVNSLDESIEKNKFPTPTVLPSIDRRSKNTSPDEHHSTKLNPKEPLPSIGQVPNTKTRGAETNVVDLFEKCDGKDCIVPKPPSEKKPERKFIRKNIFKKLKSIFTTSK